MAYHEMQAWRKRGDYLPEFMRDFHDQKDLFKALQEVVDRANAKHENSSHRSLSASWSEYHIYTVDIFLWVLSAHGYTLQKARRKFAFRDIYEFVKEARDRAQTASAAMLSSAFAAARLKGKDHE